MKLDSTVLSPEEVDRLREFAFRAISPINPASSKPELKPVKWFGQRTEAGRKLPHYYLVYFLLVELLRFPHSGRWEKVAWSIPIEFEGKLYFIEHRKFGLGVFCEKPDAQEEEAKRIVALIAKGVNVADPFFRSLATEAVQKSQVNVKNMSVGLFGRYEYLRDKFLGQLETANEQKGKAVTTELQGESKEITFPFFSLRTEAMWIGTAAVDAFFAWTEHLFIHLAIIQGRTKTGEELTELIKAEWGTKFKQAFDISDKTTKDFYDSLGTIRRQIRNYMAHGSFGKQGEAFMFHSRAGAVPVVLDDRGSGYFSLFEESPFEEEAAIKTIEEFVAYLKSGDLYPAWMYIQEADLPLILTYASDGTYSNAMQSEADMESLIEGLIHRMDNAANMDW